MYRLADSDLLTLKNLAVLINTETVFAESSFSLISSTILLKKSSIIGSMTEESAVDLKERETLIDF